MEGQGGRQQPQQRRPREPVGQVQHNQAAVKQKLLERLADDVRTSKHDTRYVYLCVYVLCLEWPCEVGSTGAFLLDVPLLR